MRHRARPLLRFGLLALLAAAASACADDATESQPDGTEESDPERPDFQATDVEPGDAEAVAVLLEPTQQLVRISMALRGTRPSAADLAQVAEQPDALAGIVDGWLDGPEFGETVRDVYDEAFLLRVDFAYYPAGFVPMQGIEGEELDDVNKDVMEAPLRLIEHVVRSDRPLTEIVTADYTLANATTAEIWGSVDYDQAAGGWQETAWTDRPNAGVLSDSWIYQRWTSTLSNANRGRANAISRALLCYDFLSRDIEIDGAIDLSDPNVVQEAVVANEACASCHQTLDPLAAYFQDFWPLFVPGTEPYPLASYYPGLFEDLLGVEMRDPSYFGLEGEGLVALGENIASDPRFSLCQASRFYAHFHQVSLDEVPLEAAARFQDTLTESGMSAKALVKAIVTDPAFLASHYEGIAEGDAAERDLAPSVFVARPSQLARFFEDLAGLSWKTNFGEDIGTVDLPRDSFVGYAVLGGSTDGMFVTRPTHTASATTRLFQAAYAQEAATWVVDHDLVIDDRSARKLLQLVDADTVSEDETREQVAALVARIFGAVPQPASDEVEETHALFRAALAHGGDPVRAWEVVLSAMFQDVRVISY